MNRVGNLWSHNFHTLCAAAWLALIAAPHPAAGQAPSGPAPPSAGAANQVPTTTAAGSLAESVDVSVISVDVVVRNRSGELIAGLKRNDFTLYEDGRKVEITNFALAGGAAPVALQPPSMDTSNPAAPPSTGNLPARERLYLAVYVDNANLHPNDRNRILKQLRVFLDTTLRQDDQVLLVTHDLAGLRVRHLFRESLSALGAELDQLPRESAGGISTDLATRQTMELIRTLGCKRIDEATNIARAHAESILAEIRVTYANLHHLLESLGSLDGRKVLIYVGDGVPTQVGTDVFGMIDEKCAQGSPQSLHNILYATPQLHQVTAAANANGVTLYTLEGAGLTNYASAEHEGRPLISFDLTQRVNADRQDSLTNLATETGGRAALNGNDFTHDLAQIRADLEGGYSLGFTPAHAGDGKVHDLRIEVDRPGARAIHRSSYRDRTPDERLEGLLEAALLHGQADNPLAASLKLGAAAPAEHGKVLVPLQLRIPFSKLALLPQEDGRHGRLMVLAGTIDEHGAMSRVQRAQVPLLVADADLAKTLASNLGYDLKLVLDPGIQRVAIAVRDDASHFTSCLIQSLTVDKSGTATPRPGQ